MFHFHIVYWYFIFTIIYTVIPLFRYAECSDPFRKDEKTQTVQNITEFTESTLDSKTIRSIFISTVTISNTNLDIMKSSNSEVKGLISSTINATIDYIDSNTTTPPSSVELTSDMTTSKRNLNNSNKVISEIKDVSNTISTKKTLLPTIVLVLSINFAFLLVMIIIILYFYHEKIKRNNLTSQTKFVMNDDF